ncbi:MAG: PD-(D/E)XK nuclease family protein [Cyanobacteria bacterium P01_G01_bin.67]
MAEQDLIRLSQSHLNLLSICPPKFQRVYLDCLGSLAAPEQQESMQWGSRFHLLMQQRELNLPIESLLATDSELDRSLKALIKAAPELEPDPNIWREAEHCRTLCQDDFLFTVIYDLLIAQADRAVILDWKTYRQPIGSKKLQQNWQTRLYLYVLAETSEYKPEQIQMTYWFVKSGQPKSVTINYSQLKHEQTEQELTILLANLKTWLQNYQEFKTDFPHRANCENTCPFYQDFAEADPEQEIIRSISEIEEVSI